MRFVTYLLIYIAGFVTYPLLVMAYVAYVWMD